MVDVDASGLSALAAESPNIDTAVCDMASRADIERVVPDAVRALSGLDVLVNNAGISGPTSSVEDYDPAAWDAVMQINLNGTFNVTRLAIPHLKQSRAGPIIVMSSVAGRFGYPNRSAYSVGLLLPGSSASYGHSARVFRGRLKVGSTLTTDGDVRRYKNFTSSKRRCLCEQTH